LKSFIGEKALRIANIMRKRPPSRRAETIAVSLLGVALLVEMATLSGCDSGERHVSDPEAAAKTLTDPSGGPKAKPSSNKKLQQFVEQNEREIAKHPKIR
jgi:hypothetical protein